MPYLCVERERRPNAGARMPKLLNEEEDEDDFYTNAYGGFGEEADDIDYESETSVEDSVDSDFANDSDRGGGAGSGDDNGGDDDDEGRKKHSRSNRVVTKGYLEPKRQKHADADDFVRRIASDDLGYTASSSDASKRVKLAGVKQPLAGVTLEPRKLRRSTTLATIESSSGLDRRRPIDKSDTAVRRKAMLAEIAQRKNVPEVRRLTQAELLAEAKVTEEINKRSLARYQRMEVEKKKARIQKTVHSTPMIRYHSFTVPIIEDQPDIYAVSVTNDSGLPAHYFDPLTQTPYANLAAFRMLRRLYAIHLETNASPLELLREYRNT